MEHLTTMESMNTSVLRRHAVRIGPNLLVAVCLAMTASFHDVGVSTIRGGRGARSRQIPHSAYPTSAPGTLRCFIAFCVSAVPGLGLPGRSRDAC